MLHWLYIAQPLKPLINLEKCNFSLNNLEEWWYFNHCCPELSISTMTMFCHFFIPEWKGDDDFLKQAREPESK